MATLVGANTLVIRDTLLAGNPEYFDEVFALVRAILNARDAQKYFMFVEKIVMPLVKMVFIEAQTPIPDDTSLRNSCCELFANHSIRIAAIGCSENCYAEYDVEKAM